MNTIENIDPRIERDVGAECALAPAAVPSAAGDIAAADDTHKTLNKQDEVIIRGSLWAAIWHMTWPLFLNMVTIAVASFVDLYVAGKLGRRLRLLLV
jgi:hypothetical protein